MDGSFTDLPGDDWLTNFNRRRDTWLAGGVSEPVGPQCRRCEISVGSASVDPLVMGEILSIDTQFEVLYDRFTCRPGGPGYHLYRRLTGNGMGADDQLVFEVSFQRYFIVAEAGRVVTKPWPLGEPCVPTLAFIPILKAALRRGESAGETERKRRDRNKENRAKGVRKALNTERDRMKEIVPYLPAEVGGQGRLINRTGLPLIAAKEVNRLIFAG